MWLRFKDGSQIHLNFEKFWINVLQKELYFDEI